MLDFQFSLQRSAIFNVTVEWEANERLVDAAFVASAIASTLRMRVFQGSEPFHFRVQAQELLSGDTQVVDGRTLDEETAKRLNKAIDKAMGDISL